MQWQHIQLNRLDEAVARKQSCSTELNIEACLQQLADDATQDTHSLASNVYVFIRIDIRISLNIRVKVTYDELMGKICSQRTFFKYTNMT